MSRPSSTKRRRSESRTGVPPIWGLAPLAATLLLWQLFGQESSVYAPRPSRWVERVSAFLESGSIQAASLESVTTFLLGLGISTVLGTAVGALVGRLPVVDRALGPLFEFFRVMPPAAMVPIAVLVAGYSESMKVGIVIISAIWPILLQVRSATRSIDPIVFEVARVFHLSWWDRNRKLILPSLVPAILQGMRMATPTILVIVLLVEIVTRINGIGGLMDQAQQNYDSAGLYGLLVLTGVIALTANIALHYADRWLLRNRGQ